MPDRLLKFLFQQAPVRGEVVRLSASWQQMTALHAYPEPVLRLLGETTAAATLLAAIIKFAGLRVKAVRFFFDRYSSSEWWTNSILPSRLICSVEQTPRRSPV